MHERCCGQRAHPSSQRQRRAASPQRRASSSARDRRSDAHTADPVERLAQAPVGVGDQERNAERATPRPPFGDNVGAVDGTVKGKRQGQDRDARARGRQPRPPCPPAAPSGSPRQDRRRPAGSAPCLMPRETRRSTTRSRCSSTRRMRSSPARSAGCEVQREAEGVEPLVTARPRRCDPAGCCLTPQSLSPPPPGTPACLRPSSFPPDRCRKHAPNRSESA